MEIYDENSRDPTTSFNFEEGGRGCRNRKKQLDPISCPVCSITLRPQEFDAHLLTEIEKLDKLPPSKIKVNGCKTAPSSSNGSSSSSSSTSQIMNKSEADKNWETYQKVRSNRTNRLRTKTRKRKLEESTCPICNKEVSEEITGHVEKCLRKTENCTSDNEDSNSIDIETYEEYEWAGQTRVRSTSLLEGGVASLGTSVGGTEEDEDLNVDGDSDIYGPPQYTEKDIIIPGQYQNEEDIALRQAVIEGTEPNNDSSDCSDDSDQDNDKKVETIQTNGDPILEVLKSKVKELENRLQNKNKEYFKCLICMETYRTPVISVCCWHVHCEQCWLQTLGAKKLCPQCNMITSTSDLRRVYM